ncbi:MAG: indolepyruvate oxidoreductase subunit beta [Bacteroidales bacterium]|nr:indolepyruvate oxidoreductase subunit beta [Bacteroidales bacterium]
MNTNILLSGVGGQGILTIGAVFGMAAMLNNYHIKQAETHGMSQRGGEVVSHVRISDKPIYSDLIPHATADIILSVEPLESLRYLHFLKPNGWLITNDTPFRNIVAYPTQDVVFEAIKTVKNNRIVAADTLAKSLGNLKTSNIIMLGVASNYIELPYETLQQGIIEIFKKKGDKVVALNLKALDLGRESIL